MLEPRSPAAFLWLFVFCALLGFGVLMLEGARVGDALYLCGGNAFLIGAIRWRVTRIRRRRNG
jgi:hypothetical protein